MRSMLIVVGSLSILLKWTTSIEISNLTFPSDFGFGAASSAYQIEGAWNESGKGLSIWDDVVHTSSIFSNGSTGDIADDSYHRYEEDIAMLKNLGVNHYRFSLSWPRILPTGFANEINPAGIQYYNNLIDGLLAEGIEPWVTLYHWDLPILISSLGGWDNPATIQYLTDFADVAFQYFGDRVKTWLTINEPHSFCVIFPTTLAEYGQTEAIGITEYQCGHNVIRAHAKIYRLYQRKYKWAQRGRLSIVLSVAYGVPASNSSGDIAAAKRKLDFELGWMLHPLVYGDYPSTMIDNIGNFSAIQGYPWSRLPSFTLEEKLEVWGAIDFVAINHYTSDLVTDTSAEIKAPGFYNDASLTNSKDPSWETTAAAGFTVNPAEFRKLLVYIKENYKNPEIVITEQGYGDLPDTFNDTGRISYYQAYLSSALQAIHEDKVKLKAYTAWSLMDDFEWISGYSIRFGLYHVNFTDANRTRTPKESATFYKNVITTKCLVDTCA